MLSPKTFAFPRRSALYAHICLRPFQSIFRWEREGSLSHRFGASPSSRCSLRSVKNSSWFSSSSSYTTLLLQTIMPSSIISSPTPSSYAWLRLPSLPSLPLFVFRIFRLRLVSRWGRLNDGRAKIDTTNDSCPSRSRVLELIICWLSQLSLIDRASSTRFSTVSYHPKFRVVFWPRRWCFFSPANGQFFISTRRGKACRGLEH